MRSGTGGELVSSRSNEAKALAKKKAFCGLEGCTFFATTPSGIGLRMKRANKCDTPTHNATTTKAYSVSFPVCIVWSQLSNISTRGQIRQMNRTSVTITREVRDRMASSITHEHLDLIAQSTGKPEMEC